MGMLGSTFLKELQCKIWRKLKRKLSTKFGKYRTLLLSREISDKVFLYSLQERYESIRDFLRVFKARKEPRGFLDSDTKEEIVRIISCEFPEIAKKTVAQADKFCSHTFNLLGSGDINLDQFIEKKCAKEKCGYLPWHFDFKSGYHWNPRKYYKEIEIPYGKADIKVPWELSRFHHLITLGQAYWLTDNEEYAKEFKKQVENWIERNPPKFGVNWSCTMEVAIRVTNWIWGYYFFKDSKSLTDDFSLKFLKSLLVHGRHISNNLEIYDGLTTNHYLSDLVGLIYLGILFPEFKEARKWREFGIQGLIKEMENQVYSDGMDFEASTCYHRLALELFFYSTLLCQLNNVELPGTFMQKLKKMFDFILYVIKPNGKIPQIGDNDNGRLHTLANRDILDLTYLLSLAAMFFTDPKYKVREFGFAPEANWLFGPTAYKQWQEMPEGSISKIESKSFLQGGIYVIRNEKDFMIISAGPNGQCGKGGHAHNDKLAFELFIENVDIVVDPGTYIYTAHPEWRNKFRSTRYHNTIEVDRKEQNRLGSSIFRLREDTNIKLNHWEKRGTGYFLDIQHNGYERLSNPVTHRRRVSLNEKNNYWIIQDILTGKGTHQIVLYFHLDPKIKVTTLSDDLAFLSHPALYKRNVAFLTKGIDKIKIDKGYISYGYGSKTKSLVIKCSKEGTLPIKITTLIYPYSKKTLHSPSPEVLKDVARFMDEFS